MKGPVFPTMRLIRARTVPAQSIHSQISFNWRMDKPMVIHPYNGILLNNKGEQSTDTITGMNTFR